MIKLLKEGESFIVSYKTTYYSNNLPNIEKINFMSGMITLSIKVYLKQKNKKILTSYFELNPSLNPFIPR